ncbi:tetratricopeptide repeat protein [bacterium]|nr:tetratricopeptide repeat protein [bacterium]
MYLVLFFAFLISLSGCATLTHSKNLSSHNSDAYAHYCMGVICENKGEIGKAIGEYESTVQADGMAVRPRYNLAKLYIKAGLVEQAAEQYRVLSELDPKNKGLSTVLSALYLHQGLMCSKQRDYERAIIFYKKLLKIYRSDLAYYYLGVAYERLGKIQCATKQFNLAIKLNPNCAETYNYLGYMYVDKGMRLNKSIKLIKKAIEIEPENGYFIDSLGWAYYKKGMLDQAMFQLERAVKLTKGEKDDPIIRDHLGDVYFQKQMYNKAIEQWEKAIELGAEESEMIRMKIKNAGRK